MNHEQLKLMLGDYACIAYTDHGLVFTSKERGIAPLVELCELNKAKQELFAADKVIGKAAALLCIYCNIKMLYARVISKPALEVLEDNGIDTNYDKLVPYIKNRTGNGKCPMEKLAKGVDDPEMMFKKAKEFVDKNQGE